MPEFNLDQYKKAWQEQLIEQKYGNAEILNMLNKKSRSYIKYIVWISVLEFSFFLALTVYYLFNEQDVNNYIILLEKLGIQSNEEVIMNFEYIYLAMKCLSLLITGFFVIKFILNYIEIKVESNLKKFILQIINFKRTVNIFIFTNIFLLVIFTAILSIFVFHTLETQHIDLSRDTTIGLFTGFFITTILSVVLIWLYYRVVYGIIMKRLGTHLKQLKEIEEAE